jgi:hypothetical protein
VTLFSRLRIDRRASADVLVLAGCGLFLFGLWKVAGTGITCLVAGAVVFGVGIALAMSGE